MSLITDYLAANPIRANYWQADYVKIQDGRASGAYGPRRETELLEKHFFKLRMEATEWAHDYLSICGLLPDPGSEPTVTIPVSLLRRLTHALKGLHRDRGFARRITTNQIGSHFRADASRPQRGKGIRSA